MNDRIEPLYVLRLALHRSHYRVQLVSDVIRPTETYQRVHSCAVVLLAQQVVRRLGEEEEYAELQHR